MRVVKEGNLLMVFNAPPHVEVQLQALVPLYRDYVAPEITNGSGAAEVLKPKRGRPSKAMLAAKQQKLQEAEKAAYMREIDEDNPTAAEFENLPDEEEGIEVAEAPSATLDADISIDEIFDIGDFVVDDSELDKLFKDAV